MNVAVVGGQCDSKSFVIAVHVAILARQKFPPFQYKTHPLEKQDFEKWLADLCEEENWPLDELRKERVVCWYEVGAPGGAKRLLGGLYPFLEYLSDNYGVHRQLTLKQVEAIVKLRQQQMKLDNEYETIMKKLKTTLTISIIGAGTNPAVNMLIYAILRLKGRPLQDGIYIRLYDKHETNMKILEEIKNRFNAIENRMGFGFISICKNFKQLVNECDVLIFLGENFRTPGMDVEKLLYKERVLYGVYGVLCNRHVRHRTRIVFCCMENSCFNATAFVEKAPSLRSGRIVVITAHLGGEVKAYVSKVSGFPVGNIVDIPVWGMTDVSHMVDVAKGRLLFRYPDISSDYFPNYDTYRERCGTAMKLLVTALQVLQRKRALRSYEGESLTKEEEAEAKREERRRKTQALLGWAKSLRNLAGKGDSEARAMLQEVREELAELAEEGEFNFAINLNAFSQGIIGFYEKNWNGRPEDKETHIQKLIEKELKRYYGKDKCFVVEDDDGEVREKFPTYSKKKRQSSKVSWKSLKEGRHYSASQGSRQGSAYCEKDESKEKDADGLIVTSQEFKDLCQDNAETEELLGKGGTKAEVEDTSECSEVQDERFEMRKLGYISNSLKNMWHYVGIAKDLVRRETGKDPMISQIWELTNLLKIWFLDPCRKNEVIFLGIVSDGSYSLPKGMVMSQPAALNSEEVWEVFPDGAHVFPDPPEDSYNPHREVPAQKQSLCPQPYSLPSVVSIARMCLKHFSIAPEIETIDDIVAKRLLQKELIKWRLEKMEADYEYRELKTFNFDVPIEPRDKKGIYHEGMEEGGAEAVWQEKAEMESEAETQEVKYASSTVELKGTELGSQSGTPIREFSKESRGKMIGTQTSGTESSLKNELEAMKQSWDEYEQSGRMADSCDEVEGEGYLDDILRRATGSGNTLSEKEKRELFDKEGRDVNHMKYLEGIGFYDLGSDEESPDEDGLEPEYQELLKTALKEYFGLESEDGKGKNDVKGLKGEKITRSQKNGKKRRKIQVWPADNEEGEEMYTDIDYEEYGEEYDEMEEIKPPSSVPSEPIILQHGIGLKLYIEEELGNTFLATNLEVELPTSRFPSLDRVHEYEKPYVYKPGFPLNFQGKSSTDIYKILLKADQDKLREQFEALSSRVSSIYEEEIAKGNIIEDTEDVIIVNNTKLTANDNNKSKIQEMSRNNEEGNLENKKEDSCEKSLSSESIDREESSDSFWSQNKDLSSMALEKNLKGRTKLKIETNNDLASSEVSSSLNSMSTSASKKQGDGNFLPVCCPAEKGDAIEGTSKIEKAIKLGLLKEQKRTVPIVMLRSESSSDVNEEESEEKKVEDEEEEENPEHQMTKEEERKLVQCREKLWKQFKKIMEVDDIELEDGSLVKLQDIENELLKTEQQIKAKCSTFLEFVKMSREHAWRGGEYRGDTRPSWSFRNKKKNETYKDFKVKSLIRGIALRTALLKQKEEEYISQNNEYVDSKEEITNQTD